MNPKEYWGTVKPVIAVDIDGTLCEDDSFPNYAEAKPRSGQIRYLKELTEKCFIVLWSARYEADREVTIAWLKKYSVPYHRLVLGKMPYDIFVDANAFGGFLELGLGMESKNERCPED